MNARLQVFDKGRGRACIVGPRKDSTEARALAAWLAEQIAVVRFELRTATRAFYADYDDGITLPGRFIRSLRDKIHTFNRTDCKQAPRLDAARRRNILIE
jgi:hypothetical protein